MSVVGGSFVVLLAGFRLLERVWPKAQRLRILRRGFGVDLGYWFISPLVTRTATAVALALLLAPLVWFLHGSFDRDLVMHGFGPASRLPFWLQALAILALAEIIGYWMHRAFHRVPWLWKFHAVHHSSVDLDWLSAVRVHPVNDLLMKLVTALPILAMGFAPVAIAAVMPVLTLLAIGVHAHVDWDFGPLRGVIASPRFHRWHHADEAGARDCNFAGLLPVLDIVFGTWYMPADARPRVFGTATPVPAGLIGQWAFPFRRKAI